MAGDFRRIWTQLLLTAILYEVLRFTILTPLLALLLRFFLVTSGKTVLADQDILYFLISPVGLAALLIVGAVWLGIGAMRLAALMTIAFGARKGHLVDHREALLFSLRRSWDILKLTSRVVGWSLLLAGPFLAAIGLVYLLFLTQFDINYYLSVKPPDFWVAVAFSVCLVGAMTFFLIRLLSGWVLVLPILLFGGGNAKNALKRSREMVSGRRRTVLFWLMGLLLAFLALSTLTGGLVGLGAQLLIPWVSGSLRLLVSTAGLLFILWGAISAALSFVAVSALALLIVTLFEAGSPGTETPGWITALPALGEKTGFMLRRKGLAVMAGAALAAAVVTGYLILENFSIQDRATITAHRGSSAAAPENTLAAVELAIAEKAEWVEIDVQATADGKVVVIHDGDLKKLAGKELRVTESTWQELKDIDVGSWFSPEFSDQRIPLLEEVLELCRGRAGVNIELKYYEPVGRLEEKVIGVVEEAGMAGEIIVMSLKYEAVQRVRKLRPQWKVGLLNAVSIGDLNRLDTDFLAVETKLATRGFIRSTHKAGREAMVWTINDPLGMSVMISRGIDSVITDKPAMGRKVLEQRAQMNPLERLLLELFVIFGGSLEEPTGELRP
jgi:glycerophosphoryl diester phosphodiesterase